MATNSTVQTVTGPVDAAELGRTLVHEHIRISYWGEEYERHEGWNRAETVALAVDKMGELLDAGFRTFVDPCPIELGRDPELYAEIAQRSGMNIVCTTGFYTEHMGWGLPVYWRARDPEEVAEHYVAELTEGIAGTGGIRPGAIKAATGLDVTDAERRMLTGAALAQHETGVAIITHTENSRHGDVQQDIFESGGAELGRVLIGHQDEQEDVAPIRKLAGTGHVRRHRPHRPRDPGPRRAASRPRRDAGARGLHEPGLPLAGPHLRVDRAPLDHVDAARGAGTARRDGRGDRVAGHEAALHVHRHGLRPDAEGARRHRRRRREDLRRQPAAAPRRVLSTRSASSAGPGGRPRNIRRPTPTRHRPGPNPHRRTST